MEYFRKNYNTKELKFDNEKIRISGALLELIKEMLKLQPD